MWVFENWIFADGQISEDSVGKALIQFWHWRFEPDHESIESDPCSGRPSTSKRLDHIYDNAK